MNDEYDGQFELLNQLLGDKPLQQQNGSQGQVIEQKDELEKPHAAPQHVHRVADHTPPSIVETRPDPGREQRKGAPEIIFGETKGTSQIIAMAQGLLAGSGRAVISRLAPEAIAPVQAAFRDYTVRIREAARAMVIYSPEYIRTYTGGHVGVISAGTSDIPVADEAALVSEEMGCRVTCIYDVGVAGLHRLIGPLRDLLNDNADAIIVAAGMDGALPSVVSGLVPVPVIGLPTSIGYGMGGKGVAALLSMLQTCAPGLSVVNIDNGVGAGITAALIANRVAQAREHQSQ
ncbi:MAG TPA: nickel pincer cofactor biosynthesis protein LarB [Ktedonosporobacter sp.]|nr:nickel pincer cofactor biosynthesis protein LarB [Ktedonosporobacter sp.]